MKNTGVIKSKEMMPQSNRIFNPGILRYVEGDATLPRGGGHRMIIHVCNDEGKWGKGFVLALSKRWQKPEQEYRIWYRSQGEGRNKFRLGEIQIVEIQSELAVVNMIGQHGIEPDENGIAPIRYEAIKSCLEKIAKEAKDRGSSIHLPRIGCGLAGGTWDKIEPLLIECLINKGINVTVYDFPQQRINVSE